MGEIYKIGDIAKAAQVNIQTVRYYEHLGILKPISRMSSGYRLYDETSIERLKFIKKAQELGFTLGEIEELLKLSVSNLNQCDVVKKKTFEKVKSIEEKIKILTKIKKILEGLIECCEHRTKTAECPILKSLK